MDSFLPRWVQWGANRCLKFSISASVHFLLDRCQNHSTLSFLGTKPSSCFLWRLNGQEFEEQNDDTVP